MIINANEFSILLDTTDETRVKRFVAHASVMISDEKLYPLDETSVKTYDNQTLVQFRNLTTKQRKQVSWYFCAVEFSFLMK